MRGGSLEGLVDRGLDATRANMDGLAERLHYGIELCEYRRSICEDYARRYATWQARLETYESRVRTLGPNIDISRPHKPHPPAAWVER